MIGAWGMWGLLTKRAELEKGVGMGIGEMSVGRVDKKTVNNPKSRQSINALARASSVVLGSPDVSCRREGLASTCASSKSSRMWSDVTDRAVGSSQQPEYWQTRQLSA